MSNICIITLNCINTDDLFQIFFPIFVLVRFQVPQNPPKNKQTYKEKITLAFLPTLITGERPHVIDLDQLYVSPPIVIESIII